MYRYIKKIQYTYTLHYVLPYFRIAVGIDCSINPTKHLPAIFESYATPVPQTPLSRAAATSPAQRVPWLLNQSSVYLGYGNGSFELKS